MFIFFKSLYNLIGAAMDLLYSIIGIIKSKFWIIPMFIIIFPIYGTLMIYLFIVAFFVSKSYELQFGGSFRPEEHGVKDLEFYLTRRAKQKRTEGNDE